ncbi:FAD-dependent oxidoreductase [Undibacterium terreum]|uniref:Oxygenase n=1 Tax=Undibacterium terreum TaxID=1224302 RepID=A0A916UBE6_9BURK|nr:FAD-dependent oxidoreductase [Undibacterium terreum]GGC64840.1 oxygenase [Undibacterium terreum]
MSDVLIVGAGPTGLALALWLTKQGIKVRIIDKSAGPGETSRAIVVQARTLELYRQLDIAEAVVSAGHKNPSINMWARGKHRARIVFSDAGADITPYPFVTVYPQDLHERLLVDKLLTMGVAVERKTELVGFEDKGEYVAARLRQADGAESVVEAQYLAGCDGARSTVRQQMGTGFEGGTYKHAFYVADVDASGLEPADEAHGALDSGDFILVFSYGTEGHRRLIGTVRDERAEKVETLTFDDVRQDAINHLGLKVHKVNWFSTYRVHHRIAEEFQRGRVFLLGDAGHIHSPAGGQGMNTGILDANNLAWKLADVIKGHALAQLLESYALERQAFARKLVATTDRLFTLATSEGGVADFIKTHIVPAFASLAYKIHDVQEFLFKTVSQTTVHYRESPLSEGSAGDVQGGDRLPWTGSVGPDNYLGPAKVEIGWQVHVYGSASTALRTWCDEHSMALQVFDWNDGYQKLGLARDAIYLLRPDTYVALANAEGSVDALDRYFSSRTYTWAGAAKT